MKVNVSRLSLAELERTMRQLDRRKQQLQKERAKDVRQQIDALLERAGLSLSDVYPRAAKAPARRGRPPGKATKKRGRRRGARKTVNPPKYRNPANPAQTWTGHGKRPQWFTDAQKRGKEKDLLIKGAA